MNDLERISYFGRVWKELIPHIPAPQPEDVGRWLYYGDRVVMLALLRVRRKFPANQIGPTFDASNAHRYATGTMKAIEGQKQKGTQCNAA